MKKKKATSMDIAKMAGVSQSTVSMILNKRYDVSFSKATIKKVEEAASVLNYHIPKRKIRTSKKREKLIVRRDDFLCQKIEKTSLHL